MKKIVTTLAIAAMLVTTTTHAKPNYSGAASPSSLGLTVSALNKKYNLNLRPDYDYSDPTNVVKSKTLFTTPDNSDCLVGVDTERGKIQSISISQNYRLEGNDKCNFSTTSSGIKINENSTYIDVLNQTKLDDVIFVVGCPPMNCPARIEFHDEMIISRSKDNYVTTFYPYGGNLEYANYIVKSKHPNAILLPNNFPDDTGDNVDFDKINREFYEEIPAISSTSDDNKINAFYDRTHIKKYAIKSYRLKEKTQGFSISKK